MIHEWISKDRAKADQSASSGRNAGFV